MNGTGNAWLFAAVIASCPVGRVTAQNPQPAPTGERPIISVNGQYITRRSIDRVLEERYGPTMKAELVHEMLIEQEADRLHVVPADAEVDEVFLEQRDTNWQFAKELEMKPWAESDSKKNIRLQIERNSILVHGIPVTDDQRLEEYRAHPAVYDVPEMAHVQLAVVLDATVTDSVRHLMALKTDPSVIEGNYPGAVRFIGHDRKMTLQRAFADMKTNEAVFTMKPDDVKVVAPGEFEKLGAKALVIRLFDTSPGKKANLSDPKVREKLTINVAMQRAKPWQEYLSRLWADAKLVFEDENDKRNIEAQFFPDRVRPAAGQAR